MAFSAENSMLDLIYIPVLTHMHPQKHTPPTTRHRHHAYTLHIHTTYAHTMHMHNTHTEAPTAITLSQKFRVCTQTPCPGLAMASVCLALTGGLCPLELAMLFSAVWSPKLLSILICNFGFYFIFFPPHFSSDIYRGN